MKVVALCPELRPTIVARSSLLSRSSPTSQGVHAHGRTPALFAPSLPQQHQHPGLSLHHRHHLAPPRGDGWTILTGRAARARARDRNATDTPTDIRFE